MTTQTPPPAEPSSLTCCRCGAEHTRKAQSMCKPCHAAYMQSWRSKQARMFKRLKEITRTLSRELIEGDAPNRAGEG